MGLMGFFLYLLLFFYKFLCSFFQCLAFIYDDVFDNRNWAGACWGHWAGIGTAARLVRWLWALNSSAKAKRKRIGGGSHIASPMPKSVLP